MNFLQKLRDFLSRPTHSRTMGLLIMLVLVAAVSLTVYVAQQQQQIKQRASELCTNPDECSDEVKQNGLTDAQCASAPTFTCKITNGDKYNIMGCK